MVGVLCSVFGIWNAKGTGTGDGNWKCISFGLWSEREERGFISLSASAVSTASNNPADRRLPVKASGKW